MSQIADGHLVHVTVHGELGEKRSTIERRHTTEPQVVLDVGVIAEPEEGLRVVDEGFDWEGFRVGYLVITTKGGDHRFDSRVLERGEQVLGAVFG